MRDWAPDPDRLAERITAIRTLGVPNYFGEQRFGRNGANLARADALFHGAIRRPSRHQQGLWLSAARSQVFNQVLAARLTRGDWDRPLPGDCLNLDGSHSWFPADTIDDTLRGRAARLDLHPTGPLWGRGDPPTGGEVRALEDAVAAAHPGWPAGLARFGLEQERRALRLLVADLGWDLTDRGCALAFELPAGAYATAVLRELMDWGGAAKTNIFSTRFIAICYIWGKCTSSLSAVSPTRPVNIRSARGPWTIGTGSQGAPRF